MVADYLPAGFEIDNPHLVSSGDTGTLDWIDGRRGAGEHRIPRRPLHRRDRPQAATTKAVFTVAYVVRAVSPGKYVLPQAYVEDMYHPARYGRTGTGSVEVRRRNERRCAIAQLSASDPVHARPARLRRRAPAMTAMRRSSAFVALLSRSVGAAACVDRLARSAAARHRPRSSRRRVRRPQRQAAARLCHGRRPLAAAGDAITDVDPRFFKLLFAYEDKRFRVA